MGKNVRKGSRTNLQRSVLAASTPGSEPMPTRESYDRNSDTQRVMKQGQVPTERVRASNVPWQEEFDEFLAICGLYLGRTPILLDWHSGSGLGRFEDVYGVVSPLSVYDGEVLPYLSKSVDVVITSHPSPAQMAEAHRVASLAVLTLFSSDAFQRRQPSELSITWTENVPVERFPSTSIIIPSFNCERLLGSCLRQLARTLPAQLQAEIVVVDDASTDETWEVIQQFASHDRRILSIRNEKNMGFGDTCNRGAALASGDVLFFLNQDTEPQRGWLPPLLQRLSCNPDIGAVGSMLIYPDGTLQEAGGVVFSDGTAANFGRGLTPDHALVSYTREVDYCSAAALAIRRTLFERLGGFDQLYRPAYYEDTDLCMRVWGEGSQVVFEPESQIVHLEGSVHGTDVTAGGKRHQVKNRQKFVNRWSRQLANHPAPPANYNMAVWYALSVRQPQRSARS